MTVICATHFTDSSHAAQRVAAALAVAGVEPLLLVNVSEIGAFTERSLSNNRRSALAALAREAADLDEQRSNVAVAVVTGALGPTLWQFCADRGASLLVIGESAHLTSALQRNVLDQIADEVAIPVMVVRDDGPLLAWLSGVAPLRVMLTVELGAPAARVLAWSHVLARYGPVTFVLAHLWSPENEAARRGVPCAVAGASLDDVARSIRTEFEHALSLLPVGHANKLHLEISSAHTADQLLDASVSEQVDLLVVATHPSATALSRLGSVSRNVLELAPMSVVCVPEPRPHPLALPKWASAPLIRGGAA